MPIMVMATTKQAQPLQILDGGMNAKMSFQGKLVGVAGESGGLNEAMRWGWGWAGLGGGPGGAG